MNSSAAPLGISIFTQDHKNPGVGCEEVMPHTHQRVSSTRTHGGVHPWKLEEEAGQVWGQRRLGQWSYPAHRTDHLPSGRYGQRVKRCSLPFFSLVCEFPMAASQWGPPALSHPQGRGLSIGPSQTLCSSISIPDMTQWDAGPSGPP